MSYSLGNSETAAGTVSLEKKGSYLTCTRKRVLFDVPVADDHCRPKWAIPTQGMVLDPTFLRLCRDVQSSGE